jgi:CRISPR-associated protein Cmr3
MNKVGSLKFRIVEPMMFRGPGEFDVSSRGAQSSARSLAMPTPSTIMGALLASLIKNESEIPAAKDDWTKEYSIFIGANGVIRGPYLVAGQWTFVEDGVNNVLLKLEEIKILCEQFKKSNFEENKENIISKAKRRGIPSFVERVGVGLCARTNPSIKVTKEGLLYSAYFTDYSSRETAGAHIHIDMNIKEDIWGRISDSRIVRLGGEGRVSLLETTNDTVIGKLKDEFWNDIDIFTGELALFLISPTLFKTGKEEFELKEEIRGYIKKACDEVKEVMICGEASVLGAGYSFTKGRRKPIYLALKQGSIIVTAVTNCRLEALYWNGIGEIGNEIGYGSAIPVPITY